MTRNFYKVFFPSLALAFGIGLNITSSQLIQAYVPDRPIPRDLLFQITPYIEWTQYLSDPAVIVSLALLVYYVFSGRTKIVPVVLTTFAVAEILRGVMILLNPLGSPLGPDMQYGAVNFLPIEQFGQFPSGHMIFVTLCYLLIERKEAPSIKAFLIFCIFIQIIALVFSRGHYSMDIIGGFLIAYLAYNETRKYRTRLVLWP